MISDPARGDAAIALVELQLSTRKTNVAAAQVVSDPIRDDGVMAGLSVTPCEERGVGLCVGGVCLRIDKYCYLKKSPVAAATEGDLPTLAGGVTNRSSPTCRTWISKFV